jgi:hypothetical protein
MIRHIVLFKFKETAEGKTKSENLLAFKALLEALPAQIPQIRYQQVGINSEKASSENYDLALISDFESLEDLQQYIIHPSHVAVGNFSKPRRLTRTCVDYEI